MKKITFLIALCFFFLGISNSANSQAKDYKFKFQVDGLKDTIVFLANYYGKKQYYKDTAEVDSKGNFVFEGKEIPGGVYLMVMPDKKSYFEFVISGTENAFEVSTTRGNFMKTMKVKGSPENEAFFNYQNYIGEKGMMAQMLSDKMKAFENSGKEDSVEVYKKKVEVINDEVNAFKERFIADNEGLLISKILKASADPVMPEKIEPREGETEEQAKFRIFKAQYLQGFDFSDDRLLRSPVFHRKLEYYLTKLVVQIPDSITKEADALVKRTKGNTETFKYVVHWTTNHYEKSKVMGMDAVFVHMADNYYDYEKVYWMDSTKIDKVNERADALRPLLLGKVAPNIILPDTNGESGAWYNLHKTNAKFTILYFWDSGCGHCKKATPKLRKWYNEEAKGKNVEVFAVGTELENKEWVKFIKDKKLNWINVSDTPEINKNAAKYIQRTTLNSLNFRSIYDIYSTPVVYVLDQNKEIIAKRLGVEQLGDFIDRYEKEAAKMAEEQLH